MYLHTIISYMLSSVLCSHVIICTCYTVPYSVPLFTGVYSNGYDSSDYDDDDDDDEFYDQYMNIRQGKGLVTNYGEG